MTKGFVMGWRRQNHFMCLIAVFVAVFLIGLLYSTLVWYVNRAPLSQSTLKKMSHTKPLEGRELRRYIRDMKVIHGYQIAGAASEGRL